MKKWILFLLIPVIVSGCKKGNSAATIVYPAKTVLVYPSQNSVCTEGNVISATQSSIVFKWSISESTESYVLNLKNLITGFSTTHATTKAELDVTILRGTPYSWFVISKSSKSATTAQSDEWKFYNSGTGKESYSPFPAEIISPLKGQEITSNTGKIILDWEGSDVDDDIINYDVYLSTNSSPSLLKNNITESKLADVIISANTTYYWKIITKDSKGNSSDSGIFNFKVN